jgi:hypothetical protein
MKSYVTRFCLPFVSLVAFSGCAVDATSTESVSQTSEAITVITPAPVAFPDGVKFLSITAEGTGCPKDAESYSVDIAPDGQVFTVTFNQYEASIAAGEAVRASDCQLNVKVNMPQGLTFAVQSFSYGGYVFLENPGMRASQQSWYYYSGAPVLSTRGKTTWFGPVDTDYLVTDTVATTDLVWKPCGAERSLQVPTKIKLYNNTAKNGQGYINTLAGDGSIKFQYTFKLAFDHCQ